MMKIPFLFRAWLIIAHFLILVLILSACKQSQALISYKSLTDSVALEIQLPARQLAQIEKARERTKQTQAKQENKTGRVQSRQEGKTERAGISENKAVQRAQIKSNTKIAKQEQKTARAIPNALKWAFALAVVFGLYQIISKIQSRLL